LHKEIRVARGEMGSRKRVGLLHEEIGIGKSENIELGNEHGKEKMCGKQSEIGVLRRRSERSR
jgi:hypothetical protein